MPSAYDEAAAAFIEAAAPIAAYCQRAPRPNRHADQLDTFLLRGAALGEAGDQLQKAYEGSPRIRDFCAGIRARLALMDEPPPHQLQLARLITSHCFPLPAHARPTTQPLCQPAAQPAAPEADHPAA